MSDASIGALFSRAVYLTKEVAVAPADVFPELAAFEHDHYNTVSAAHFGKADAKAVAPVYFHKQFDGAHSLSNGYDYFFHAKRSGWDLQCCAAVVLLDYFNAKVGGKAFTKRCRTELATGIHNTLEGMFAFLDGQEYDIDGYLRVIRRATTRGRKALLPSPLPTLREKSSDDEGDEEEEEQDVLSSENDDRPVEKCCCPLMCESRNSDGELEDSDNCWDPEMCIFTVERFNSAVSFMEEMLADAPLFIMGDKVKLSYEHFVIRGNQIHVLSGLQMQPVNFANCWDGISKFNLLRRQIVLYAHCIHWSRRFSFRSSPTVSCTSVSTFFSTVG
jgi:hypothetical protein